MATNPALSGLQGQEDSYTKKLYDSPTALGGDQPATGPDLNAQVRLRNTQSKIQGIVDKQVQEKWFGPNATGTIDSEGGNVPREGPIGRFLNAIGAPLYGLTGAAEYAMGKGTEVSLGANIASNVKEGHRTFGTLLKKSMPNAPWIVSAPLGFALDVAGDPVNWATMGAAATIPRIVKPFLGQAIKEGGIAAAGKASLRGLQTSLPGRIATRAGASVIRNTAGLASKAPGLADDVASRGVGLAERFSKTNVGKSIAKNTDEYNTLVGRDIGKIVEKRGIPGTEYMNSGYRLTLRNVVEKAAEKMPGGENFLRTLDYNVNQWVKQARLKDSLERILGTSDDTERAMQAFARGEDTRPIFQEMIDRSKNAPGANYIPEINFDVGPGPARKEIDDFIAHLSTVEKGRYAAMAKNVVREADDASSIAFDPKMAVSGDPVENAVRLAEMDLGFKSGSITREDIKKIYGTANENLHKSGVEWYDRSMEKVRSLKYTLKFGKNAKTINYGNNVINGYNGFIQAFKFAKVPASVAAWTNAVIGNPTMALMSGENVFSKGYMTELYKSRNFFKGKPGSSAFLHDLLMQSDMQSFIANNPTAFSRTVGISPKRLGARFVAEKAMLMGRDAGIVTPWKTVDELEPEIESALTELRKIAVSSKTEELAQGVAAKTPRMKVGGLQMARDLMKSKKMTPGEMPSSYLSNELFDQEETWFRNMMDVIAQKSADPNAPQSWKLLNLMTNRAMDGYESIDQVYKMATFRNATIHGYTEAELVKLRNAVDLNASDLTKAVAEDGVARWRLAPPQALELANQNYLNYNAMPPAVKMLRNIPILGSPFISFMYGMLQKTGNTVVHNPALFNKMQFAINDFGGLQTPLEKKSQEGKYYSYLKDPGMMRLPFFEKYPVYLNMANMIPYYSFNMFTPSERRYTDLLPNTLVAAIDKSPFAKDPVAAVIFDYLILPHIIGEGNQPVGSFGQPLFPYGATGGEKSLYALRSLAESVVPGTVSMAGGLITPDSLAEYAPSYRWRQIANAKYGKNQYGKSTKEGGLLKTFRSLLSSSGIPTNRMDLTFTAGSVKNNLK